EAGVLTAGGKAWAGDVGTVTAGGGAAVPAGGGGEAPTTGTPPLLPFFSRAALHWSVVRCTVGGPRLPRGESRGDPCPATCPVPTRRKPPTFTTAAIGWPALSTNTSTMRPTSVPPVVLTSVPRTEAGLWISAVGGGSSARVCGATRASSTNRIGHCRRIRGLRF